MKSELEHKLLFQIRAIELPDPEIEYKFHPKRRWRLDFAYPDIKLAIEVEGGTWSGGRHTRGKGFENDCIKYSEAMLLGWDVYRCTGGMINSGIAINMIEKLFNMKSEN